MKKLLTICAVVTMILAVGNASAVISWGTAPVLGTAATPQENGDILVETDTGLIGIPAPGNRPYGDGVSMNIFLADPETGLATVAHGSSANIDVSVEFTISALWYLNDELQTDSVSVAFPNYDVLAPDYELFWGNETE
jgi:hypothetical protein